MVIARTPEELATLLEDALVLRDPAAVVELLADGVARGADRGPAAVAAALLDDGATARARTAAGQRVRQSRDVALLFCSGAADVARRGRDGGWRYAILSGIQT